MLRIDSERVFRRPEMFEIVILLISAAGLAVSIIFVFEDQSGLSRLERDVVGIAIASIIPCLAGQAVIQEAAVRYFFLAVQFIATIVLPGLIAYSGNTVEILLVGILVVQFGLRLSLPNATIASFLTTLLLFAFGVQQDESVWERLSVLSLEVVLICIAEASMYYREKLVQMHHFSAMQQQSIRNLSVANQSFVEHLESVEEDSAERERFRITRELHDTIGYSMTNVAMMMNAAPHLINENPRKLLEYCRKTKDVASETLRETRKILYRLRDMEAQKPQSPPMFFSRLCHDFSVATEIVTECSTGNLPEKVHERVFTVLYRSVQVGFINALRHGNSTHIKLFFWMDDDELRMIIWNNMPQDHPAAKAVEKEGIGLKGIRERLAGVNGDLTLENVADGFRMIITIPKEEIYVEADSSDHS